MADREIKAAPGGDYWVGRFSAMASPCELLIELTDRHEAQHLLDIAADEAQRIEQKFSRYRSNNIVHRINHAMGEIVDVDEETARLLDYATLLFQLSDGLFDITAGVLRQIWRFEKGASLPEPTAVKRCLQHIGWGKVHWQSPSITLPAGMEIDLGGIGKEYAVDRTALLLAAETDASLVINYGGDLFINKPRNDNSPWQIAVDDPSATGVNNMGSLAINAGAIATSGDARRHLLHQGKRYGHILNPKTGYPVENSPRSITVHAPNCMQAGMLATIAMLHGEGAESFLKEQESPYWLVQ